MNAYPEDTALIQGLVAHAGTTPAAVARKAGVAVSTVNRPFNGSATNRLGRAVLEKLEAAFPDFPGWTSTAKGLADRRLSFKHEPLERPDTVELPEFDLAYGMGASYIGDGVIEKQPIVFSRTWIRNFTGSPIDKLFFARGIGDSMEPKIFDSDILLIDTAQDTPRMWDQIWALDVGGLGMIKRLRPEKDGGMRLISDNKDVPDYVAYDEEMHLIGRVVGIMRKT